MNKTPEIRFPEFEGLWLDTKLGELMDFRNGMNADKSRYGRGYKFVNVLDVIAEAPILDKNIIGRVDADSDEVARFGLKSGDVVFQRSSETREDAGQANAYIGKGEALFGGFVIRGRPKVSFDVQYMAALLRTDNARKNTTNLAGGSTRFNVGQETLSSVQINIAPTLLEQKKIAAFLSAVDEKLAALEAQLSGWRNYKRGLVQALFSQTLRLKADDGSDFPDWVASELGVVVERNPRRAPSEITFDYPCIEMDCLVSNYGKIVNVHEFGNQKSNKSYFHSGDVLFGKLRPYLRKFARPNFDGACSTEIWVLNGNGLRNDYLFQLVQTPSFVAASNKTSGSKMPRADWGMMKDYPIRVPALAEQQKIADALSAIDAKIEALTARLDATRKFKRGLLQKMFV